jgi:hypothetical protein
MAIVDDRGRVAGRVNLIDAVAAVVFILVVPIAYGSYLLFRTPPAKLTAVAPASLYEGPNLRIGIGGRNLRPFMRVSFDDIQGKTFMVSSTTNAAIDLPDLKPGTYDVVLYDHMEEIDRLKKAFTLLPLAPQPTVEVEVSGSFLYLSTMNPITPGQKFPPTGDALAQVLSVGAPIPAGLHPRAGEAGLSVPIDGQVQLPASLRVHCYVATNADGTLRCMYPGPTQPLAIAAESILSLQGPQGWVTFQIAEVHAASKPPVTRGRVTFSVTDPILSKMKAGDTDVNPRAAGLGNSARIVSIDGARPGPDGRLLTATLDVPVDQVPQGWTYKREPFKIGAPFSFETPTYLVHGVVIDMAPPQAASGTTSR